MKDICKTPIEDKEAKYYTVIAYISRIFYTLDENSLSLIYDGCLNCNKKVHNSTVCPHCSTTNIAKRMLGKINLTDTTMCDVEFAVFNSALQTIFGCTAEELSKKLHDTVFINELLTHKVLWRPYIFTVKVRKETTLHNSYRSFYTIFDVSKFFA